MSGAHIIRTLFVLPWLLLMIGSPCAGAESTFASHPPMRPLPVASDRPLAAGRALFVDGQRGDDQGVGSQAKPWKTVTHAVQQLVPGDTLYLAGGTYFEHVRITARGTAAKPITIRSLPGQLAVIDGGLREFLESPAAAWEPCPSGVAGEFWSVNRYAELGGSAGGTNVLGNFADSMIPLHGYRYLTDLRSSNEYFSELDEGKTGEGDGVYCGPGVYYDVQTERIHVRLAHTRQKALGDDNYRGETDPRKLPLIIAGLNAGSTLSLDGVRYVRIQDIVFCGSRSATVTMLNCINVDFDGVTAYGGATAFSVRDCAGLRLWNSACRGIAAPWTYRGSLKYRAIEAQVFSAGGWSPTLTDRHNFELAYSEFTDCVDGVFIGNVKNVRFHHNLLDNISDDGMFLTSTTAYDGKTPGGDIHIYQNLLSRCLTTFAFGVGHGRQRMTPAGSQTGTGVFVYRNIFDFRRPVMYGQPAADAELDAYGRVAGDHGGLQWEPMTIYHNTILPSDTPFRNYYLAGLGSHLEGGAMRRLFNNIVAHSDGMPGQVFPPVILPPDEKTLAAATKTESSEPDPLADLLDKDVTAKPAGKNFSKEVDEDAIVELKTTLAKKAEQKPPLPIDFQADGNLHWSYIETPTIDGMFSAFRDSAAYESSRHWYRAGWGAHDLAADPGFAGYAPDWRTAIDVGLRPGSPAVDAGVELPREWPDPLRTEDAGRPDVGALPLGTDAWQVGVRGRWTVFGQPADPAAQTVAAPATFLVSDKQIPTESPRTERPVMILEGYPAFDAPLIRFVLQRKGIPFESLRNRWLDPAEYGKYGTVIVVGDLARARIEPHTYSPEDLPLVEKYLENGGTLMLMRGNSGLFATPQARRVLIRFTGAERGPGNGYEILQRSHPWLKHLDPQRTPRWVNATNVSAIQASQGEMVIGNKAGWATLYRVNVGKGRLIYFGWDVAASLPSGRSISTVEQETSYEEQWQLLESIIDEL